MICVRRGDGYDDYGRRSNRDDRNYAGHSDRGYYGDFSDYDPYRDKPSFFERLFGGGSFWDRITGRDDMHNDTRQYRNSAPMSELEHSKQDYKYAKEEYDEMRHRVGRGRMNAEDREIERCFKEAEHEYNKAFAYDHDQMKQKVAYKEKNKASAVVEDAEVKAESAIDDSDDSEDFDDSKDEVVASRGLFTRKPKPIPASKTAPIVCTNVVAERRTLDEAMYTMIVERVE